MRSRFAIVLSFVLSLATALVTGSASAGAFTPGNVVVYRVGTGAAALTAAATPVFLDEYTPAGVFVQTIAMPTADAGANQMFTSSGSATTEGLMTRSADGRYLVMAGYDAAVATTPIVSTTGATINRVFARVDASGTVDTSTATTTFSAGNPRGATSVDGSGFWGSGSNTGLVYVPFGTSTVTVVSSTFTNLRALNIGGTQLYVSSQASTLRLGSVGTGTPTTTGQTITSIPGFPTATNLTNQFAFVDLDNTVAGVDTIYVADDRSTATGGGVQKWTFDGTTWTQRGTLSTGLSSGLRGLTATASGSTVTIFATDASATGRLVTATDSSGAAANITGTFSTLVTGAANTAMRSVAFAPQAIVATTPTVTSIVRADATPTSAATINFTVTFSESVTGVGTGDFSLSTGGGVAGASVTGVSGSGTTYNVAVNRGSGEGTIRLDLVDDDSITNGTNPLGGAGAGNGNFSGGETYAIAIPPTITSLVRALPSPSNATTLTWNMTVSEPVQNVDANDFAIVTTGATTGGTVFAITADGPTGFIISVNAFAGDGTLGLNVVPGGIEDLNGNLLASGFTGEVYAVDQTAPEVSSVVRANASPTSAASVDFTVTFSENVTGVDTTDFTITAGGGVSGASVTGVSGSGTTYTVTVNTGTGDGTLRLDVADDGTIADTAGNTLGSPYAAGESYTIQKSAPSVTSIVRADANPTNAAAVAFTVTFNSPVTGVDTADFTLTSAGITGASVSSVTGSGTTYTVSVNSGSGDGTIRLDLVDDDTIVNATSTPLGGAGAGNGDFTTGEEYTLDRTAPSVTSVARAGSSPTTAASVDFTVTFSESVTGVDSSDFSLTTTGVTGASVTGVSGSGMIYTVTVGTGTGDGTIRLDVADDDSIVDAVSNPLAAAFTTGESYTMDYTPAAPTGLVATGGNNTVSLTWNTSSGATGYNVKRATVSGGPYTTIAPNVATTTYSDNTATNGTTYYYVVSALNASGESADSGQQSATPALPANQIGVVISQLFGGNGGAYKNDYIELYNPTLGTVNISGYALQYGSATGQFGSVATNIYTFPASTTIAPGKYLSVKFGTPSATGADVVSDITVATGLNMSGASGKVAFTINGTALGCGATATPCALPHASIVDVVAYGTANNGEGGTSVKNGTALATSEGGLRKLDGCQDTSNNNNDFIVATTGTGLVPRTAATPANVCGAVNNPPTITAPANPITTVNENAAPFTVSLAGNDDGGIYTWAATPGTGVASVSVSGGQGTASVTYTVTLQTNFYGTATFTASLSDGVHPSATQAVNISVTRDLGIDHVPTITAPANPITAVAQNAAPFTVSLSGNDDNGIYTWGATPGAGVDSVSVTAGQGTAGVTYTVTVTAGFSGTATFTASLSDGVNPPATQAVNISVTPSGSSVNHPVISQVYGAGGNAGATWSHDYVEIYNPTGSPVNLTGWSLQYSSATNTGNFSGIAPLGGTIGAGQYFLVQLGSNDTSVGAPLVAPTLMGDINMSGSNGKIALVNDSNAISGSCGTLLTDPNIVDFVGYGSTANCSEGNNNAPTPANNQSALLRASNGNVDTDNNGNDFSNGAAAPQPHVAPVEVGPFVVSTEPSANNNNAPRDANLVIIFNESVDISGSSWYDINCTTSGNHNSATFSRSGTRSWTIVPNVNFIPGENCTATLFASQIRDTDTDDSNPGTDFLASNHSWTFTISTGTAPAYSTPVHVTFGNPSDAVNSLSVPDNFLMEKPEFTLSYNRSRNTPNWVSWHLADEWVGTLQRVDTFRADPAIDPTWYRVLGSDYSGSGFDRGHLVPNADRDKETSSPINQATFLMTNMLPQAPDNNQGPWANMENYLRTLLPANELYIVAGGAGTGGTGANGFMNTITTFNGGVITVPAQTWKVVVILPKASGDDVARVTAQTCTLAVLMPNTQGIRTNDPNDWMQYITTVDAIEALTGYDFFENVPDAIEAAIEGGTNCVNKPGAANLTAVVAEDGSTGVTLEGVSPSNAPLTYTVVSQPSNGSLSGSGANQTYTPAPDFFGSDSFTYKVNDGQDSNVATVTLTITEVNDVPVAVADPKSTAANTPLNFPATDLALNDSPGPLNEAGQSLTVTAVASTPGTNGSVSLVAGTVTYTPAVNFSGAANFSYTVCDNGTTAGAAASQCTTGTVNVNVTAQVPVAITAVAGTPQSATVGTAFAAQLQARVADGSNQPVAGVSVTFAAPVAGASGTFASSATVVTDVNGIATAPVFTANAITGSYNVTATAGALSTSFALTNVALPATQLQVTGPVSTAPGAPFSITVTALDANGGVVPAYAGTIHFTTNAPASSLPADYTFTLADGGTHTFSNLSLTAPDGPYSITATDVATPSITGSHGIQVIAPVCPAPANTPMTIDANVCAFSTGNVASVTAVGGASSFTWSITNGTITSGQGTNSITFTAGGTGTVSLQVLSAGPCAVQTSSGVSAIRPAPTAVIDMASANVCAGTQVIIPVTLTGTAPFTIHWSDGVTQRNLTSRQVTRTVTITESKSFRITQVTDASCTSSRGVDSVGFSVVQAPLISKAPVNQTLKPGSRAELFVVASDPSATYQWFEGESGDESHPVAGATSSEFESLPLGRSTKFWVKVSNQCGSVNSSAATITIAAPIRRRAANS